MWLTSFPNLIYWIGYFCLLCSLGTLVKGWLCMCGFLSGLAPFGYNLMRLWNSLKLAFVIAPEEGRAALLLPLEGRNLSFSLGLHWPSRNDGFLLLLVRFMLLTKTFLDRNVEVPCFCTPYDLYSLHPNGDRKQKSRILNGLSWLWGNKGSSLLPDGYENAGSLLNFFWHYPVDNIEAPH